MAKFQKGHKLAKGGKRVGAGRPTREKVEAKKLAKQMVLEYIEAHLAPVLDAYRQLASGRPVKHYNQQTGKYIYTDHEVDSPTLRHYIDKFLPEAAKRLEVTGEDGKPIEIKSTDGFDFEKYAKLLGVATAGVGNGKGVSPADGYGKQIYSAHAD